MPQAAGNFTVSNFNESTYQELGENAKLTRATWTFALDGDITGEASWESLMCYRPDSTAAYTGMQRIQGRLAGAEGSFVVRADGEYSAGEARTSWRVVEGSGTGGLTGLTGHGEAVAGSTPPGHYTLDYKLG